MENNMNELVEIADKGLNELDEFLESVFELTQTAYETVVNSAFFNTVIDCRHKEP